LLVVTYIVHQVDLQRFMAHITLELERLVSRKQLEVTGRGLDEM
jgi:hypothetical protein